MERILFDGRPDPHPASLPDMADRVIHVGCVSIEQRMIGWRVGWVVAPAVVADDMARAHIYNGLTAGGIAQAGAVAALRAPADGPAAAVAEWERRRDAILEQLHGLPAVRPAGGWSLLMDVDALGALGADLSRALVDQKVAATPMTAWGERVAPGTSGSSTAGSRSSACPGLASGCAPRWISCPEDADHNPATVEEAGRRYSR